MRKPHDFHENRISFVTFEGISYVIDIWRGLAKPGTFFEAFMFLSFFPKIVSGPIVLFRDFKPQIKERNINVSLVSHGFERIIIGYAEKSIIADTFGLQITMIKDLAGTTSDTLTLWLMAILYFFELYFDFAGYSQIAIGISEILGFKFSENFNYPYISTSISEFWRRWHISLGNFFREYVYIPLGGNRTGNVYVNLFIVFILTGIWHGANWTFILWGLVHGLFIVLERYLQEKRWYNDIPKGIKWLVTMIIIFFTWILFSSVDVKTAFATYKDMFCWSENTSVNFGWRFFLTRKIVTLLFIAGFFSVLPVFHLDKKIEKIDDNLIGFIIKRVILTGLFLLDILFVVNSSYCPFLYFQF